VKKLQDWEEKPKNPSILYRNVPPALMMNYETKALVYFEPKLINSSWKNLPLCKWNNINDIFKELSDAMYHVERNGNAKIILTDLSIKLTINP
jgi:DNA polymerase-3 subunit delta'